MEFRPDIQGLRAVAVLSVLAFHAGVPFMGGGYIGVDVFFVVSGFLITGLLLRDVERAGSVGSKLAGFYARRARRILPASIVVLVATLLVAAVLENALVVYNAAHDARAAALFSANLRFVNWLGYFGPRAPSFFQHYWTLSLEEQFYAIWPLLLFAIVAITPARHRQRALVAFVSLICLASFALGIAWLFDNSWHSSNPSRAFYLLPPRAWELGLGALLAIIAPQLTKLGGRARAVLAPAGLAAIAIGVVTLAHVPFPGWAALLPTLGTGALVAAGIGAPIGGAVGRLLNNPLAQRVGLYSYSLYLWHWPVLQLVVPRVHVFNSSWLARSVVMVAISAPASVITYHGVENPVRYARMLRGHSVRTVAIATAAIALFVGATPVLQHREESMLHASKPVSPAALADAPTLVATPFVPSNVEPKLTVAGKIGYLDHACRNVCDQPDIEGTRVVLLGDSHAEHLAVALTHASRANDASLVAYMRPACGWFGLPDSLGRLATQCNEFVRDWLDKIAANPPALVILSGEADWAQGEQGLAEWKAHASATLAAIPKQTKVAVISQTPYGSDAPACLATNVNNTAACDRVWPTAFNLVLKQITDDAGDGFIDLKSKLCLGETCPSVIGNLLVWADHHHFTAEFASSLEPFLTEQIGPFLRA